MEAGGNFRRGEILSVGDLFCRNTGPYLVGTWIFCQYGSCPQNKTVGQKRGLVEDYTVFMDPDITANVFVLPDYPVFFLKDKERRPALVAVIMCVNATASPKITPGADVDGTRTVENGKRTDDDVGFASAVVNTSGERISFPLLTFPWGLRRIFFRAARNSALLWVALSNSIKSSK